jgi:hypothetical protein
VKRLIFALIWQGEKCTASFFALCLDDGNNGYWSGIRGDPNWVSTNSEVQQLTNGQPIVFKNGYPQFSNFAVTEFKSLALQGTNADFKLANEWLAGEMGFSSTTAARKWVGSNNLTWHHVEDTVTLELIPSPINEIPHSGGASLLERIYGPNP